MSKEVPVERPTHHWPPWSVRPTISVLPSPSKSPTLTSAQVTLGFQVVQRLVAKEVVLLMPVHHWPLWRTRPVMSEAPSPLKSPTLTSTHVTLGLQVENK